VAADLERLRLDGCVCLGDVVQGGPQPAESLARLRRLSCSTVLGNSDRFLLEVPENSPEPLTEQHLEVREWTLACLGPDDLEYIRSFEPVVEMTVEPATRLLACHGSPRSFDDVLLPWSEDHAFEPFSSVEADVLAGGHTHIQWARRLGEMLFVNPGSVGLAYDHHQPEDDFRLTPIAEYAIVTGRERQPSVEFRRVPYSLEELLAAIRASGRPHAESFAGQWDKGH
jgi:predicted phosphodiesterase